MIILFLCFIHYALGIPSAIRLPFRVVDNLLDTEKILTDRQLVTTLCYHANDCHNTSISFSDYVPWRCFDGDISELRAPNRKDIYIGTSQLSASGKLISSEFIYENEKINFGYVQVFSYNEVCFQIKRKFDVDGEIGFNLQDINSKTLVNMSFIEQIYNKSENSIMKFGILYNSLKEGEIVLGNFDYNVKEEPVIELSIEKDYIRSFNTYAEDLFFTQKSFHVKEPLTRQFSLGVKIYMSINVMFTCLPIQFLDAFMLTNERLGINKYNSTTSFRSYCKIKRKSSTFTSIIECTKDIDTILLPTFKIKFDGKCIEIDPNESFITIEDRKIFPIAFSSVSSNLILGQNFFQNYFSIFDINNKTLKMYHKPTQPLLFSSTTVVNKFIKTILQFAIILLLFFFLITVGFVLYNRKKRINNQSIDYTEETDSSSQYEKISQYKLKY